MSTHLAASSHATNTLSALDPLKAVEKTAAASSIETHCLHKGPQGIRTIKDAQRQVELELMEELGLGEALLLGRRGTQATQWRVLTTIQALPIDPMEGASEDELLQLVSERLSEPDHRDLVAEIKALISQGRIVEVEPGRYRHGGLAYLQADDKANMIQAIQEALRLVSRQILAGNTKEERASLVNIVIDLPGSDSEEAFDAFKTAIQDVRSRYVDTEGSSQLQLLYAASLKWQGGS